MRRTIVSAGGALLAAAAALFLLYPTASGVALEMDRQPPGFATGLYPAERDGDTTFVWTSGRVNLRLVGLDRTVDWTCTTRVRGARDASLPMPSIAIATDATAVQTTTLSNEYQEITAHAPASPGASGLTLTADVGPTFVPGGADRRDLGAQVDWIRCTPDGRAAPPAAALRAAAVATGAIGLVVAASGAPLAVVAGAIALVAVAVALLLSTGNGAFGAYPSLVAWIGIAAAALLGVAAAAPRLVGRRRLSGPAVMAAIATAVLGALELAALTHPAKALVDAVFQSHRLSAVLGGHYFFTQPLPDGVAFPYAIGLYVAASPLAGLITDHILLLRMVVVAANALAGGLLYLFLARGIQAPMAGVAAVVLFHLVPLPYVVIGNANLTNAFAQAVALGAIASFALMPSPARTAGAIAALIAATVLTTTAFLSHVSTIALLAAAAGAMAVALFVGDRRYRRLAAAIVVILVVAGALAAGLYYRHFGEVYERAFERVLAPAETVVEDVPPASAAPDETDTTPAALVRQLTWGERATDTVRQTVDQVGWPILLLAVAGTTTMVARPRDRLSLVIAGWLAAWVICLFAGTMTRVDTQYQRYAAEFIGRVNLACYPAAVLLAGLGVGRLRRAGVIGRIAAALLVSAAVAIGVSSWLGWFS